MTRSSSPCLVASTDWAALAPGKGRRSAEGEEELKFGPQKLYGMSKGGPRACAFPLNGDSKQLNVIPVPILGKRALLERAGETIRVRENQAAAVLDVCSRFDNQQHPRIRHISLGVFFTSGRPRKRSISTPRCGSLVQLQRRCPKGRHTLARRSLPSKDAQSRTGGEALGLVRRASREVLNLRCDYTRLLDAGLTDGGRAAEMPVLPPGSTS
ncbi:hypothetical protein EVG20_g10284 [Dentipellis fragilis]|uniref:Uncharacterized protein n=1 Tax=Dentipellis fragilis TaxID=205917 RepID=A0A4Y9XSP0_9AGAM|nr:hypothetical protein EVG20_g10284 [Dentipellis fragilis]